LRWLRRSTTVAAVARKKVRNVCINTYVLHQTPFRKPEMIPRADVCYTSVECSFRKQRSEKSFFSVIRSQTLGFGRKRYGLIFIHKCTKHQFIQQFTSVYISLLNITLTVRRYDSEWYHFLMIFAVLDVSLMCHSLHVTVNKCIN